MTLLALMLAMYSFVGLTGFGGALFVIEGPYLKPLTSFFEKRKGKNWFYALMHKGLTCFTCQGFWFGALAGLAFLTPMSVWLVTTLRLWAFLLSCAFVGSAVSTLCSYLMSWYFDWRTLKGLSSGEQNDAPGV